MKRVLKVYDTAVIPFSEIGVLNLDEVTTSVFQSICRKYSAKQYHLLIGYESGYLHDSCHIPYHDVYKNIRAMNQEEAVLNAIRLGRGKSDLNKIMNHYKNKEKI